MDLSYRIKKDFKTWLWFHATHPCLSTSAVGVICAISRTSAPSSEKLLQDTFTINILLRRSFLCIACLKASTRKSSV